MSQSEEGIRRRIGEARLRARSTQDIIPIKDEIERLQDSIMSRGRVDSYAKQSYDALAKEFHSLVGLLRDQLREERGKVQGELSRRKSEIDGAEEDYKVETEKIEVRRQIDEDFGVDRYQTSMYELKRKYAAVEGWRGETHQMEGRMKDIDIQLGQLELLKVPELPIMEGVRPIISQPPSVEEALKVSAHMEWVPSGEFYICKIPIQNNDEFLIYDTRVVLEIPDGLKLLDPPSDTFKIGRIEPGKFGTATYKLSPERCVYGTVRGHITYIDAKNKSRIIELEEREVSGVCPLLTAEGADVKQILQRLEEGELMNTNSATVPFKGDPRVVYGVVLNCISRLKCVENDPKIIEDSFLGRSVCLGKAPGTLAAAVKPDLVVETVVSGVLSRNRGTLTIYAHSDQQTILTPFFVDVMRNVRQHVEVIEKGEEIELAVDKCPNCGTPIDLTQKTEDGIIRCKSCRYPIRLPKYGLLAPEAPTAPSIPSKVCSKCGLANDPVAKFCSKCGNRL